MEQYTEGKNNEHIISKYKYRGTPMRMDDIKIAGIIESPYQQKTVWVLAIKEWVEHAGKNLRFKLIVVNW